MKLAITKVSLIITLLALASSASADNKARADQLFKEGKSLMAEKRYADACNAFEESYKLDPGIGAQLNIAKCYEEWGKLGRAFTSYQLAEKMARDAGDARADKIKELITELDSQVPRLTLRIPKDAPKGFQVTMDKKPVTVLGEAFVVDPGPKTLEWWVGDGPKKQKIIAVERGGESEVTLDVPKGTVIKPEGGDGDGGGGDGDKKPDKPKKTTPEKPSPPGRNMRIGGIALGGAGVLAIGVSSIMTLSARGKYNDALDMYCNGMKSSCDPQGLEITHDARSTANVATVVFFVGLAAVGGGVALYLLGSKQAKAASDGEEDDGGGASEEEAMRYVVPSVSPDGAGLVYGGRF
jgi:tetratricopeptide (TPR) repeat protein